MTLQIHFTVIDVVPSLSSRFFVLFVVHGFPSQPVEADSCPFLILVLSRVSFTVVLPQRWLPECWGNLSNVVGSLPYNLKDLEMIVIVNWCNIKFNWTNAFDFLTVICVEGSSLSNLKHIHFFLLLHTPYLHLDFYEDVYSYFLCSPTAKTPNFSIMSSLLMRNLRLD